MKRYFLILKGRVQGVGCRSFAQILALQNNLTGYVKNLENGDVAIQVQGISDNLDNFLKKLLQGNNFIKIIDYSFKEIPLVNEEKKFKVIY